MARQRVDTPITRANLEEAFGSFLGETGESIRSAVPQAVVLAGAIGLGALTMAFLAGRRRGRRGSAVIEIRRA